MKHDPWIRGEKGSVSSVNLYDRLERAIIALEYALADARREHGPALSEQDSALARSQEALLTAGEEVQAVLLLLKTAALGEAAARVRGWR
jgi:hypothetical protein